MPHKKQGKRKTRPSIFSAKKFEKEIEAVIDKYRRVEFNGNVTVINEDPPDERPQDGFYLVLLVREGDTITTKSFGRDMPVDVVADSLLRSLSDLAESVTRQKPIERV